MPLKLSSWPTPLQDEVVGGHRAERDAFQPDGEIHAGRANRVHLHDHIGPGDIVDTDLPRLGEGRRMDVGQPWPIDAGEVDAIVALPCPALSKSWMMSALAPARESDFDTNLKVSLPSPP
jgi:hypothetical protein